ncbi:MAG: hypothetical protein ACXWQQ_06275 [Pseudobdellovibrio sp.]
MKIIFVTALLFLITGCTSDHDTHEPTEVNVTEIAKEQQIPKQLLLQLDADLGEEFKSSPPLYSFTPLEVLFTESQEGVLRKPAIQYNFPKGGGEIDLKNVVTSDGSFYISFPEEQFDKNNELLHLFYISNSPKTSIENEQFGMGCGKWVDLKGNFKKLQNKDFLKLNTNDLRYLRVLAGTYVFIFKQNKNVYLSQLSLTDSRHSGELCESGATL